MIKSFGNECTYYFIHQFLYYEIKILNSSLLFTNFNFYLHQLFMYYTYTLILNLIYTF